MSNNSDNTRPSSLAIQGRAIPSSDLFASSSPGPTAGSPAAIFGTSLLLQLLAAFVLALFLGAEVDATFGASAGFMVGAAWVATAFGVVYLFERRPLALFFINGGYNVVAYTVMGTILGAWH